MTRKEKKTVSILLPLELYETLVRMAEEDRRSLSGQIRQILRWYLQSQNKG